MHLFGSTLAMVYVYLLFTTRHLIATFCLSQMTTELFYLSISGKRAMLSCARFFCPWKVCKSRYRSVFYQRSPFCGGIEKKCCINVDANRMFR